MELLNLPLHGGHHMGGGPGFGLFGALQGLLVLALLVAVVVLFVKGRVGPVRWAGRGKGRGGRNFPGRGPGAPGGWAAHRPAEDAAFETLRMRLANGDITPEEYLERSSVLRTPQPPTEPKV